MVAAEPALKILNARATKTKTQTRTITSAIATDAIFNWVDDPVPTNARYIGVGQAADLSLCKFSASMST